MNKKCTMLAAICLATSFGCRAETINWDKIEFWSGEGPNRAALVIQFSTTGTTTDNPGALVWGYRWEDGAAPSGEDLLRRVAAGSPDLLPLMQMTGSMGHTLCGVGFAPEVESCLDRLQYDLEGADASKKISFGFYEPNTAMGQTSAPGDEAFTLVTEAIEEARASHVIEHPFNYSKFGYPAYDYDFWTADGPSSTFLWNAGWYNGYWSYWIGRLSSENLSYSGLGMSSTKLEDGDLQGWRYSDTADFQEPGAGTDASTWLPFNYNHKNIPSGVESLEAESGSDSVRRIFRLDGTPADGMLAPGIYIIVENGKASKKFIRK